MNINSTEKNTLYYVIIPYIFLVVTHIFLSLPMKVPVIWPDEFAYLFFGKYLSGDELLQAIPQISLVGSFGYSLLFTPIFWLFSDPHKIYSSILILNAFLGSTIYISLFYLLRQLFYTDSKKAFWIAFIVSLFPSYMLQTDVALTDAITPACFVFGVLSFNLFIRKKTIAYGILFAIIAGYLNWIHIRMLPFTIMAIFFMSFLVYYRRLSLASAGISVIVMIIMVLIGVIFGDHFTYIISGKIQASERISASLIQVVESIFVFLILLILFYFYLRKQKLLMSFTFFALIAGLLLSIGSVLFWIVEIASILYLIVQYFRKTIAIKILIQGCLLLIAIPLLGKLVIPDVNYYSIVLERLEIWFINASGSMFYALFSTYNLFFIGLLFVLLQIWNNSKIKVPAVRHTDMFDEETKYRFSFSKMLNDEISLTLLFLVASSFLMIFITIFPNKLQVSHYRADHLFYGRYVEVVLASYIAIAIYKLKEASVKDFLIATLSSWVFYIIIASLMIITYNNIIPSELSFRSVLSFFPLRAVLGNINIMLFFLASITVSIALVIGFRYKPNLGRTIIIGAFLSFTIFTYIYVDYYYQVEKAQRNKLIDFVSSEFPNTKEISYDTKVFSESSQNGLSYIWLMDNVKFDFFSSSSKKANTDLVVSNSAFGLMYDNDAILMDIEHDGNDHLWLNTNSENDSVYRKLMPSYYNIALNEQYVGGVLRSGFYKNKWINGRASIVTNINEKDSLFNIRLEVKSADEKPHNLIIWLENKEIFNRDIEQGAWRYDITVQLDTLIDRLEFKFFSDLTREEANKKLLNGIILDKFVIRKDFDDKSNSINSSADIPIYENLKDIEYTIYPRRNIDFSQLELSPGDTISLPFVIKNVGNKRIDFTENEHINFAYNWKDFIFKNIINENIENQLRGSIMPGEERELLVTLKAPETFSKYFLNFYLIMDKSLKIEQTNKREYLMNFKHK